MIRDKFTLDSYSLYVRLILLFPIMTLFQSGIFSWINKALFIVVFLCFILNYYKSGRIYKAEFICLLLLGSVYVSMLFQLSTPIYNINELIYFPFFFLYSLKSKEDAANIVEYLKDDVKYLLTVIRIWTLIVGISAFIPSCYHTSSVAGYRYFTSIADSVFRLAPTAYFVACLAIVYFMVTKKRSAIFYLILPLYCFYMGDTRTYFGAGILLILAFWYIYCPKKRTFYISIIPIAIILILVYSNSAISGKVDATQYTDTSYFDYWGTITNGRSIFWEADLNAFNGESLIGRIFGKGINYVYEVNARAVGNAIWAHNDFINVLLGFGYIGLALYIVAVCQMFKGLNGKPLTLKVIIFMSWLITATFNMFYTYSCSFFSLPILINVIGEMYTNRIESLDNDEQEEPL